MSKLPKRYIGDIIIAVDDIHFPFTVEAGTIGRISAVTIDAEFGWYQVEFEGNKFLAPIYPAHDAHIKIKGEE